METQQQATSYHFLKNAGEAGSIIANYDWSVTRLGNIDTWPPSLTITLNNLLRSAFPMFLMWGEDLLCFYNDAFRPSFGTSGKHPAIGKKAEDLWNEIWNFTGPLIHSVLNTGKPVWYENQLVPFERNGEVEEMYWTFSYSPAHDDEGNICGVLVTCMETTATVLTRRTIEETVAQRTEELEKAHESLTDANEYQQNLINIFKEPFQVLEPVWKDGEIVDFRYTLTNAAYSAYANVTPEELQGKLVSEFFPGYLETSSFIKNVEIFTTGVADTWEIHYDKDGLDLYNLMSGAKMGGEVVVHFTDFTHLKHLQLELEQKIGELERSNRQLEEFAHAASHDLKEPIRKINMFTDMLKKQLGDKLSGVEQQMFGRIESAAARMGMLVDDLLLYSYVRIQPLGKEAVDLNETVDQVLIDLDLETEQKSATINKSELPVVQGYKRQLQQLLQNLISNALKYSREDVPPVVTISSAIETIGQKRYHTITVTDNGIGFEQQYADKIFQMFTRLHTKGSYSGTGVGLSIAKKIVENHEGLISVESELGVGSSFKVCVPAT